VAESGDACDMRCSSAPSSVEVIGVGVSRAGASMRALEGLLCGSGGGCAREDGSCGGGVGSCIGTSMTESPLLLALKSGVWLNARVGVTRDSSGGQVERPAMLSCSTGDTIASSGVGMVRYDGRQNHDRRGCNLHMGRRADEEAVTE
jgi:hypothetical protein